MAYRFFRPDVRATLIRDSTHVDVDAVTIELVACANPNWSQAQPFSFYKPNSDDSSAMHQLFKLRSLTSPLANGAAPSVSLGNARQASIASLDILGTIEAQACEFEFWKVDKAILDVYPCFRGCNLGYASHVEA